MYLNKILVTTDFSEAATAAFPFARQQAAISNSSLTLLNIVEPIQGCMDLEGCPPPQILIEKAEELARNQAQNKMRETISTYFVNDHINSVVLNTFQDSGHAICKYASDNNFGLVIIASQGKGFFKRIFPGSTTGRVSRISSCPVLVVPASVINCHENNPKTNVGAFCNILVTTDFTEDSKNALKYAVFEAKANSAKLSVVHVYEQLLPPNFPDLYTNDPDYYQLQQDYIFNLEERLKEYVRQNVDIQTVSTFVVEKIYSIAYTVSEHIKKNKFDLLVISTHGTGPRINLIGGVVEEVLRLSECPVLVVPKSSN